MNGYNKHRYKSSKSDFFERLLAKARCRTEKAIQRNREVEKSEIIKKIPSRRVWREGLSYDDYKFKSKIISEYYSAQPFGEKCLGSEDFQRWSPMFLV